MILETQKLSKCFKVKENQDLIHQ